MPRAQDDPVVSRHRHSLTQRSVVRRGGRST
jgi:hypothetical protein